MLNRLEMILYKFLFWGVVPITFFLIAWWSSIGLQNDQKIASIAFAGLGFGILIDVLVLKPSLKSLETLSKEVLIGVYVFYSIMVLGFFMGVPVFNLFLGVLAGRFIARVGLYRSLDPHKMKQFIQSTGRGVTVVMVGVCLISAAIALKDPMESAVNLQGMLNLGFTVESWMVYALIVVGGIGLVALQYIITIFSANYALKHVAFDPQDPFYRPLD